MSAPRLTVDRLLAGTSDGRSLSLPEHLGLHGRMPLPSADELVQQLARAGISGRGGAGFPTARKISALARADGAKVVVANGAETEPMSEKDRVLLELTPHLVLDGLELVARATGARDTLIAVGAGSDVGAQRVKRAIAERGGQEPRVLQLPAHYLAGQETALLNYAGGGPLKPRVVPPLPVERGLRRRPTLVQNVETLAHVALIARHGYEWFRAVGSERSPGTILITLGGAVLAPGVYEVPGGARAGEVIMNAGGVTHDLRGLLVGGYFGTWFPPAGIDLHLDAGRLERHGASLGSGVIVALGALACPVAEVARIGRWLASQSARQCGPCTFGLPAIAEQMELVVSGRGDGHAKRRIQHWGGLVQRRGACHHPDGFARFVLSALETFPKEFRAHERRGPCELCSAPPTLVLPEPLRRAA